MSGWLRHFALNAQLRAGWSGAFVIWAIIAAVASMVAMVFLLLAAFIWLADRYDTLIAGVVLGCLFAAIALIALVACLKTRLRNIEHARLELAASRSNTNWLDPKLMAMGFQIGQTIGWRKLASLAAVGLLAAGLAREWSGHDKPPAEDDAPRSD
jgi:hypothetical protein